MFTTNQILYIRRTKTKTEKTIMKKTLSIIAIAVIACLFASCEKEGNQSKIKTGPDVVDCQANTYPTVWIGNKLWMAQNLCCTKYDTESERAGAILQCDQEDDASYLPYCEPNGRGQIYASGFLSSEQADKIGAFYNWAAAMGYSDKEEILAQTALYDGKRQGICPNGWHLPSIAEWNELKLCVESKASALKSTTGWLFQMNGNDTFGFNVIPTGFYDGSYVQLASKPIGVKTKLTYDYVGCVAYFVSCDCVSSTGLSTVGLWYSSSEINTVASYEKRRGLSVRCVKN